MSPVAIARVAALASAAIAISGCCQTGVNLTAAGSVSVESPPDERARVVWAEVWQDGDETVVTGRLVRRGVSSCPLTGHVDVTFFDAGGKLLKKASSLEAGLRRTSPGKGPHLSPFRLRLKLIVPENARAVIAYRGGAHEDE
ncbi:MAG: hypothetical protein WBF17_08500 [Phycisphaerae bacterium]